MPSITDPSPGDTLWDLLRKTLLVLNESSAGDPASIVAAFDLMTPEQKQSIADDLAVTSVMELKGVWNATANTPAVVSGTGNSGDVWYVGTAGTTSIDGNAAWEVGDLLIFDTATDAWKRIPGGTTVPSASTSVAGVTKYATNALLLAGDAASALTGASLFDADGYINWAYSKRWVDPTDPDNYFRIDGNGLVLNTAAGSGGIVMTGGSAGISVLGTGGGLASLFAGNSDGWISDKPIVLGSLWDDPTADGTIIRNDRIEVQGPNSQEAQGNEVVTAKDLRVNAAGGVQYTAATGSDVVVPLSGGDFTRTWVGYPTTGAFCSCNTAGGITGFVALTGIVSVTVEGTPYALPSPTNSIPERLAEYRADYDTTAGEWDFYVDGVLGLTVAGAAPTAVMRDGWVTPFTGIAYRSRVANLVPTDDEAAGAAKGESRGRLAFPGSSLTAAWQNGNAAIGANVFSGAFSSADATSVSGTTGLDGFGFASPRLRGVKGQRVVISGTIDTLTAANLRIAAYDSTGGFASNVVNISTTGAFSAVLVATADFADALISINAEASTSFSASGLAAKVEGTVQDIRPEEVTSLNRWLDASGNGYHLIPVAGARALNPQVPRNRSVTAKYDIGTSTVIVSSEDVSGVIGFKTIDGSFTLTLPAYLAGSVKGGLINTFEVSPSYVQARGQARLGTDGITFDILTKNYNADTLVDVSWYARFDFKE